MFASIIRLLAVAVPVLVQGQLNTSPYLIQQQEQEQRQQQQPGMSYNPVQEKKQQELKKKLTKHLGNEWSLMDE